MFRWFTVFCACTLGIVAGFVCWGIYATVAVERDIAEESKSGIALIGEHGATTLDQVTYSTDDLESKLIGPASTAIADLGAAANGLSQTLAKVNAPCRPIKGQVLTALDEKPCGTLADVNQTLHTVRGTFGVIETGGRHFNKSLTIYDRQELALFNETNGLLSESRSAIADMHGYMKSQAMKQFAADVQRGVHASADTAENVAGITGSVDKMTAHMEKKVDAPQPMWKTVVPGAELGAKIYACIAYHVCTQ